MRKKIALAPADGPRKKTKCNRFSCFLRIFLFLLPLLSSLYVLTAPGLLEQPVPRIQHRKSMRCSSVLSISLLLLPPLSSPYILTQKRDLLVVEKSSAGTRVPIVPTFELKRIAGYAGNNVASHDACAFALAFAAAFAFAVAFITTTLNKSSAESPFAFASKR